MGIESIIDNLRSAGIFTIVLSVLIVVHEWGHFITAKKLGVNVERFSLGFGPKLYSKIHNGTEFMLCLIPLGGYVKMAGDERSNCKGDPGEFYSQSLGSRALIVLNGPIVNFIFAYICFIFVFTLGYPDLSNTIGNLSDGYPAQEAGLQIGDTITAINSTPIKSWTDIKKNISTSKGDQINIELIRAGKKMTTAITPKIESTKNIFGETKEVRIIGISPEEEIVSLKYGLGESFVLAFQKLVEITTMTYKALYKMVIGSMPAKDNVTGPIGIYVIITRAAEMGLSHLLFIVGIVSASLAIFNLLPIIPLDGGHLFLIAAEKINGKILTPKFEDYIARFGCGLILLLVLFVFYNDFARFGWIDKIKNFFY